MRSQTKTTNLMVGGRPYNHRVLRFCFANSPPDWLWSRQPHCSRSMQRTGQDRIVQRMASGSFVIRARCSHPSSWKNKDGSSPDPGGGNASIWRASTRTLRNDALHELTGQHIHGSSNDSVLLARPLRRTRNHLRPRRSNWQAIRPKLVVLLEALSGSDTKTV